MSKIRLQKFLSQAGVCSRRQAEVLISKNKVKINGQLAKLGDSIDPATDKIEVNHRLITAESEKIYLVLNKPQGYITTRSDRHAEQTIYDLLPADLKNKVWPVGRLDKNTTGLLILTNDGELTQQMTHPSHYHEKEYLVRFIGQLTTQQIKKLTEGVKLYAGTTAPCQIWQTKLNELKITLHEGKKRQIREMLKSVGCQVTSLQRLRENKLKLNNLPLGQYRLVTKDEII